MSSPLLTRHSILAAAALALVMLVGGCKSDPVAPDNGFKDADAAALIAAAYGVQSGGFLMQLGDALSVVHGGDLPSRTEKKRGPSILRDTVVLRNRTSTSGGKDYIINYRVKYSISYTNNVFSNPKDYYFIGCKELKCLDTILMGTMTTPKVTATDSGFSQILINNTDSALYTLNGKFFRYGTYTIVGTSKTYTGKIETALIPGAKVDPATKQIVDGDVEITMKGKQADGTTTEWAGRFVFRQGLQPRLELNGKSFTLDPQRGEVISSQ
jgi:hypothetical protein